MGILFLWNGAIQKWSNIAVPESPLENLKVVHLNIAKAYDPEPLLASLFPRAPLLETLYVSIKKLGSDGEFQQFVNKLFNRPRESRLTKFVVYNPLKETEYYIINGQVVEMRCANCDLEDYI